MAFTLLPLSPVVVGQTHYAASTTTSTSDSGGETSVSGRSSTSTRPGPSLRTVTMSRRTGRHLNTLGFSLRGGREHGTGFFVSAVEKGSEAYHQGLMVGDQIVRINGLPVEDATHREVLQLIQSQSNLTFKVRSVGMIPVKDSYSDSLTWRLVEPEPGGPPELPDLQNSAFSTIHLFINVAPKAKLGCGIMKGPEWKPGIFVQYTKENSLARGHGLKPGDQIIQCNNVVFTPDIPFTEAVSVLRCTGLLELVIQKGVGLELFPGESSGYNSSASSVAGDQSPETWPHKRLSIVKEESFVDSDSRLTGSELNRTGERHKDLDRMGAPSRFTLKPQTTNGACTVIRVGTDEDQFRESVQNSNTQLAEICMVQQQLETKTTTVRVEVHQTEDEDTFNNQSDSSLCHLTNSSSVSSFSSSGANSLCSAISQEIQRRSENRAKEGSSPKKPPKVELHKCGMDQEKVEQHQLLMEEFKRAHKKMFAHTINEEQKTENSRTPLATQSREERESFRIKRQQKEELHVANMNQERVLLAVKERDLRLERDKQDMTEADRELTRLVRRQQTSIPPPPPLPANNNGTPSMNQNNTHVADVLKDNLPPLPPFPPDSPTPDYDKTSVASASSINNKNLKKTNQNCNGSVKNGNADFVEMQSLESFKLTNPSVSNPKPPPIYFQPNLNNSTTTSTTSSKMSSETIKPAVTIREYPTNKERKIPERFQFLGQSNANDLESHQSGEHLTARLQDELCQTLSKANLRRDSLPQNENVSKPRTPEKNRVTISIKAQPFPQSKEDNKVQPSSQPPFYLHHKNDTTKPNNSNNYNGKDPSARKISTTIIKQPNDNVKIEDVAKKNSFGLAEDKDAKIISVIHPNGILKNGIGTHVPQITTQSVQATKTSLKTIKFAGITTADVQ